MTNDLRRTVPEQRMQYIQPSAADEESDKSELGQGGYQNELAEEWNQTRSAPDGAKKNTGLENLEEKVVKESSDSGNSKVGQESTLLNLRAFLLEGSIAEWSTEDLISLDKLVEESGLLERMPGQLKVFYSHAFKKRRELETGQTTSQSKKEKLENYVDALVDESHFDRFFRMSTFDSEDWSSGELPWTVAKILWHRFTGFEKNEDHREFAKARMSNKSEVVPISQLRHHKEPESTTWGIILEMEALLSKLPRYRPVESIARPIENAYNELRAVVEAQAIDAYPAGKIQTPEFHWRDGSQPKRNGKPKTVSRTGKGGVTKKSKSKRGIKKINPNTFAILK